MPQETKKIKIGYNTYTVTHDNNGYSVEYRIGLGDQASEDTWTMTVHQGNEPEYKHEKWLNYNYWEPNFEESLKEDFMKALTAAFPLWDHN